MAIINSFFYVYQAGYTTRMTCRTCPTTSPDPADPPRPGRQDPNEGHQRGRRPPRRRHGRELGEAEAGAWDEVGEVAGEKIRSWRGKIWRRDTFTRGDGISMGLNMEFPIPSTGLYLFSLFFDGPHCQIHPYGDFNQVIFTKVDRNRPYLGDLPSGSSGHRKWLAGKSTIDRY